MRDSPSHGATLWYLNKKKVKSEDWYAKRRDRGTWGRDRWTSVKRGAGRKYRGARKEREAGGIDRESG